DGDNRLKHSIDAGDCSACRPAGFGSAFYDTQGRKFDTPGATSMSIDLYIPSDWAATGRRMAGFWATGFNAVDAVSLYPIVEFSSLDGRPRFRGWNSSDGTWVDMGLPTGFAYDTWHTITMEFVGSQFVYTVGDLTLSVPGGDTVVLGNVILQGHNNIAGVTYDIYWDNFSYAQGVVATDNCDPAPVVTYERSDNPA